MSLYEKIALYYIADVAVVTATRDGMNLVPYEYVVCRQGAPVGFADLLTACNLAFPQHASCLSQPAILLSQPATLPITASSCCHLLV